LPAGGGGGGYGGGGGGAGHFGYYGGGGGTYAAGSFAQIEAAKTDGNGSVQIKIP
jgi:hypothetical protein